MEKKLEIVLFKNNLVKNEERRIMGGDISEQATSDIEIQAGLSVTTPTERVVSSTYQPSLQEIINAEPRQIFLFPDTQAKYFETNELSELKMAHGGGTGYVIDARKCSRIRGDGVGGNTIGLVLTENDNNPGYRDSIAELGAAEYDLLIKKQLEIVKFLINHGAELIFIRSRNSSADSSSLRMPTNVYKKLQEEKIDIIRNNIKELILLGKKPVDSSNYLESEELRRYIDEMKKDQNEAFRKGGVDGVIALKHKSPEKMRNSVSKKLLQQQHLLVGSNIIMEETVPKEASIRPIDIKSRCLENELPGLSKAQKFFDIPSALESERKRGTLMAGLGQPLDLRTNRTKRRDLPLENFSIPAKQARLLLSASGKDKMVEKPSSAETHQRVRILAAGYQCIKYKSPMEKQENSSRKSGEAGTKDCVKRK